MVSMKARTIDDQTLDRYRLEGIKLRVVRDANRKNDVRGHLVAWNDDYVMIRKSNRNVVKLSRDYFIQPAKEPRPDFES